MESPRITVVVVVLLVGVGRESDGLRSSSGMVSYGQGGAVVFLGGHLKNTCDYGGVGNPENKRKVGNFFILFNKRWSTLVCVRVWRGGGQVEGGEGQGTGMGAGRTGLLRYNVIFYFK